MPGTRTYPGVYVEEIPSGVRTITGVATSITAFLGRAIRGPVNTATTITSYADFERTFGGLKHGFPMSYAVRDFYQNGGKQAVIVRLYRPFVPADTTDVALAEGVAAANSVKNEVIDCVLQGGTEDEKKKSVVKCAKDAADKFNSKTQLENTAAHMVSDYLMESENTVKTAQDLKLLATSAAEKAEAYLKNSYAKLKIGKTKKITLQAVSPGAWGNSLQARVVYIEGDDNTFNLKVRDDSTGFVEEFRRVTVKGPRELTRVLENESLLVRVKGDLPDNRPEDHDANLTPEQSKKEEFEVPRCSVVEDGNKCPGESNLSPAEFSGNLDKKTGIYALENIDLFNLLCIPPDNQAIDIPKKVYGDMLSYCMHRRAMLIVDPPLGWQKNELIDSDLKNNPRKQRNDDLTLNGSNARNAILTYPRIRQADADPDYSGQISTFAACGMIAGIIARTDATRGIWKAPAGLDASLNGIYSLAVKLTDEENGILNQVGINCLRSFPAAGNVVWGARTMDGDDQIGSEWKYIPVRRTALYIEESLYRGTQWAVFEPNDEPLWAQLRLNIGSFMNDLFRQGAFQGRTPREAYFVKCDNETTTQNDINRGIVNVVVGFAPLKPAEFVVIKLTQIAGKIET